MIDLTSRQMKAKIQALASQIKLLRNKASSTEFPAERDTLIRVANQQTAKMVALQTDLARIPMEVRAPTRDPITVLSDAQCHALLLAERGFPRVWKQQIGKKTWTSLVRKKYIAFPKGSDRIVATEKGKAFLMALRKEYRADMHALVFGVTILQSGATERDFAYAISPHQWATSAVLQREIDRIQKVPRPYAFVPNPRIVKVL